MDVTPDRTLFPWMGQEAASAFGMPVPGSEALGGMGKAWMQEVTALVAARLRADADTVLAMGGCTTLTDLALLQQRWLTEAGQAYSDCAQRLAHIVTDAGRTDAAAKETTEA